MAGFEGPKSIWLKWRDESMGQGQGRGHWRGRWGLDCTGSPKINYYCNIFLNLLNLISFHVLSTVVFNLRQWHITLITISTFINTHYYQYISYSM